MAVQYVDTLLMHVTHYNTNSRYFNREQYCTTQYLGTYIQRKGSKLLRVDEGRGNERSMNRTNNMPRLRCSTS